VSDPTQEPQPGWYPIAPGSAELRWWDGSKWTEHRHTHEQVAYAPNTPLRAPEGTNPTTVWAWLLAATPLLPLIGLLQWDIKGYLRAVLLVGQSDGTSSSRVVDAILSPSYFVLLGLGFLTFVLCVVFALLDYYVLKRRGIPRPFHWAWSFLQTGVVYMIGRAVIVRRRTGHGLAPLWVWIGLYVLVFVTSLAVVFSAIAAMAPLFERLSG
jgi:hypothetical protein